MQLNDYYPYRTAVELHRFNGRAGWSWAKQKRRLIFGRWSYHISSYPLKWRSRPGGFDLTDLEDLRLLNLYKDVHHRCKYWRWTC